MNVESTSPTTLPTSDSLLASDNSTNQSLLQLHNSGITIDRQIWLDTDHLVRIYDTPQTT